MVCEKFLALGEFQKTNPLREKKLCWRLECHAASRFYAGDGNTCVKKKFFRLAFSNENHRLEDGSKNVGWFLGTQFTLATVWISQNKLMLMHIAKTWIQKAVMCKQEEPLFQIIQSKASVSLFTEQEESGKKLQSAFSPDANKQRWEYQVRYQKLESDARKREKGSERTRDG